MNSINELKQKPSIITSLVSGKGGVGKTSIALSICKILQIMQNKILLVDSDLFTHGSTFFLYDEISKTETIGITELVSRTLKSNDLIRDVKKSCTQMIVQTSYDFDFIPSSSYPKKEYSLTLIENLDHVKDVLNILVNHLKISYKYDYIVIDCQAGPVFTTFSNVSNADNVIIVMEPDPISTGTMLNLMGELAKDLPKQTYALVNKLIVKEASAYYSIEEFARQINFLPPIPFDFEVRRGFLFRKIPIDLTNPSPYFLGLLRVVRDLFPEISVKLDKLESQLRNYTILPIQKNIEKLEKTYEKQMIDHRNIKEKIEYRFPIRAILPIISILIGLFFMLMINEIRTSLIQLDLKTLIISVLILFALILSIGYLSFSIEEKKDRRKILLEDLTRLEIEIDKTRNNLEEYRSLLITKKRDLLIPLSNEKK